MFQHTTYYAINVLIVDGLSYYNVVNLETQAVHSRYKRIDEALVCMRDLNRMTKMMMKKGA